MLWKYREKECGLIMSWWKKFDSFKLIPHTEYIIPDCFLPLPGDFETKNYISHLSKLVMTSSGKIVENHSIKIFEKIG